MAAVGLGTGFATASTTTTGTMPTTSAPGGSMTLAPPQATSTTTGTAAPTTVPTSPTTVVSTAQVKVFEPNAAQLQALTRAENVFEALPSTCVLALVRGTVRMATVRATGTSWALAQLRTGSSCFLSVNPGSPSAGTLPGSGVLGTYAHYGVFEQRRRGRWAMNDEAGVPFPCPTPATAQPGPGNGWIPNQVQAAWKLGPHPASCRGGVNFPGSIGDGGH